MYKDVPDCQRQHGICIQKLLLQIELAVVRAACSHWPSICVGCRKPVHKRPASAAVATGAKPSLAPADLLHGSVALPTAQWSGHRHHHAHKAQHPHLKQDLMSSMHFSRPRTAPDSRTSAAALQSGYDNTSQDFEQPASSSRSQAEAVLEGAISSRGQAEAVQQGASSSNRSPVKAVQRCASSYAERAAVGRHAYEQEQALDDVFIKAERGDTGDQGFMQQAREDYTVAMQQNSSADMSTSKACSPIQEHLAYGQSLPGPDHITEELNDRQQTQHAYPATLDTAREDPVRKDAASLAAEDPTESQAYSREQYFSALERHQQPYDVEGRLDQQDTERLQQPLEDYLEPHDTQGDQQSLDRDACRGQHDMQRREGAVGRQAGGHRRAKGQQQAWPGSRARWQAAQAAKLQAGLRHMPTAKVW